MAVFKAEKRTILGKQTKKLRRRGFIPAVLYGKGRTSVPLKLDLIEFVTAFGEAGESSVVNLVYGDERIKVIVAGVQRHPVSGNFIHVDFREIQEGEKITVTIRLRLVGESPIVKSGEGMLLTLLSDLEIECLPQDIPSDVEIGISDLKEINDSIYVRDLPLDFDVVDLPEHELDDLVAKIESAEMEELEEEVVEVPIEDIGATEERDEEEEGVEGTSEEVTDTEADDIGEEAVQEG